MAVYYPSNVNCYQQEPIYLNHQQQPSSSSSAAAAAGENFRNEMLFIPPTTTGGDVVQNHNPVSSSSELTFGDGRGLSLSLATQISLPSFQYQLGLTTKTPPFSKEMLSGQSHPSSGYAVGDYNSYRYLKPAQSLLEEVVSVKKELNRMRKKQKGQDFNNGSKDTQGGDDSNGISIELSTVERQELQSKKHKLVTMVDEVDKRYNQYYHQMEALASSFEIVAGFGSAKPYTSVALNRISCHFRALRDTIKEQIQMIREKVGEKGGESLDEEQGGERIPRLRYLDQRLRQQRALHQHLGMVRPCWRAQRGLPENSVSALRAWLFEHFLHPYPKESEKMVLAKQTGLSKNQVANWFINARVRLWKPMIEEMYKEEFGDAPELLTSKSSQEPNSTNQEDSSSQQQQENTTNDPRQQQQMKRSADYDTLVNYHGFGVDDYRYIGGDNQQHLQRLTFDVCVKIKDTFKSVNTSSF